MTRPVGTKAELEDRRRLGVALHRRGLSVRAVARELGCAPGSVSRWTKMAAEGGDAALEPIPNSGGTSRMTDEQRVKLSAYLRLGARIHGFPSELWTIKRVQTVISRELGIEYSKSTVHRLLHELGFSPQKPTRRAREQDAEAVERFRREEWPAIKKKRSRKAERSR